MGIFGNNSRHIIICYIGTSKGNSVTGSFPYWVKDYNPAYLYDEIQERLEMIPDLKSFAITNIIFLPK